MACRKIDHRPDLFEKSESLIVNKFFNLHRSNNATENALVNYLIAKNKKEPFVEKTVGLIGFPFWNKTQQFSEKMADKRGNNITGDSINAYMVPFVRDSANVVNACLMIFTTPTDTALKYICDWQYNDSVTTGISARGQSLLLMSLDKNVFGDRLYQITDTAAFGTDGMNRKICYVRLNSSGSNRAAKLNTTNQSQLWELVTISFCYEVWVPAHQGQLSGCAPGEENCNDYT